MGEGSELSGEQCVHPPRGELRLQGVGLAVFTGALSKASANSQAEHFLCAGSAVCALPSVSLQMRRLALHGVKWPDQGHTAGG